jgi:hypothetical protein
LAFGVAASGSAVGGVFFPIFMREALPIVGYISISQTYFNPLTSDSFAWTLRIIGFVLIFTFGVANLVGAVFPLFLQRCPSHLQCLVRRLPPHNAEGGLFGLHVFRSPAFTVLSVSCLLIPLGSYTGR